ncbi:hypothetical protein CTA1_11070 [Colletotrichum tanaceti]|uniref:Uncharacterized protein n=1 Tax=Colletotrichum tanaceti TaxID=1306861 RepID=A0A4U6XLF3_9PEZI|nr:hypothetical protein CTA1_11070 [Colletotrichum tanaceti]
MSDLDPVRAVLAVFPQVAEAAEKYKIAEPDFLKTELVSAGRPKGVLDKIRGKASGSARRPLKNPRTRLQKRLDVVSDTNEHLASRLSFGHTLLSRVAEGFSSGQAMEANDAQPLRFFVQPSTESLNQDSACSFNALDSEQDIASISPLQDWIRLQGADIDWKSGIELALQLSLDVVHLSPTPWIDDSWTWDSWAIATDPMASYEPAPSDTRPPSSTVWSILSRDPALGRLGLCLLELAFGHSISEIRRDGAGKGHFDRRTGCGDEIDVDVLDFVAAKQLLVSQTIRHKFEELFEDAVKACIHQQFRVGKSGDVVELDRRDPLFLQMASISIISPLRLQLDRYLRAEYRDTVPIKESPANVEGFSVRKEDLKLANRQDVVDSSTRDPRLHESTLPKERPAESWCAMGDSNSLPSEVRSAVAGQAQDRERNRTAGPDSERHGLRLPSLSNESLEDSEWAHGSATETT